MRSAANFRRIQNRVQAGAVQPVPQWHSAEERQRLIQMQLDEVNALTPNHQALVESILATREAEESTRNQVTGQHKKITNSNTAFCSFCKATASIKTPLFDITKNIFAEILICRKCLHNRQGSEMVNALPETGDKGKTTPDCPTSEFFQLAGSIPVLAVQREASFENFVAEANESVADFSKLTARQRKLEMQLISLRSKNAHIKGYRAVIVGNRIKESINGMVL